MRQLILNLLFSCLFAIASQSAIAETKTTDFILQDMAGVSHQLSNYKGQWVLVNYWATWCPPCLEEVPDLVNLYEHHNKKDLMVIGVVFDYKTVQEVKEYVSDMSISYPIVLGDDAVMEQVGVAQVMPMTFLYNPQGRLVKVKRGIVTKKMIEKLIAQEKHKPLLTKPMPN